MPPPHPRAERTPTSVGSMSIEIRPRSEEDREAVHALEGQAFRGRRVAYDPERPQPDPDRDLALGAYENGRPVATATVLDFGQWFGRRLVPMGGVTGVAVAADRRGSGAGRELLGQLIPAMRERGFAVATLFPSTLRFYRAFGWEIAGSWSTWKVPTRSLADLPRPTGITVRATSFEEVDRQQACYERTAPRHPGWLGRRGAYWKIAAWQHGKDDEVSRYAYAAERDGEVVGFIRYQHTTEDPAVYGLKVDDLVAADREAALALLHLVATNRTMTQLVELKAAPDDELLFLLGEQDVEHSSAWRWMTRLVDVRDAVAARGFSHAVRASVDLEISDPVAPWNGGRFRLEIAEGKGELHPGGDGSVRVGVGALSSLYTGWSSPWHLAAARLIDGGSEEDLAGLGAAFAGAIPWTPDFF